MDMERFIKHLGYDFDTVTTTINRRLSREEALLVIGELMFIGVDEAIGTAAIENIDNNAYITFPKTTNIDEEIIAKWILGSDRINKVTKYGKQMHLNELCNRMEAILLFQALTNQYLE